MEDFARDFVIQVGGPLPVIGGSLIVAALFGWGAIAFREESAIAIVSGLVAVGALLFALFSYPTAQSSCKDLFRNDRAKYSSSNCQVIAWCVDYGTTIICR